MTHKLLHILVVLPLLMLMASPTLAGKIYKWTDSNGEVHYSQTPPSDEKVQEMHVNVKESGSNAGSAEKSNDTKQQTAEKTPAGKQQADQQAALEKKNEEIRQENCKRANQRFRTINAGGRLYDVNDKGERVYWDDNKRASELGDAQKSVEKWCNQ